MGRLPASHDPDPFGDEVAQAFVMTTQTQREEVVSQWRSGRDYYGPYAELLQIDPQALLLASLLEAEDESVCQPNGVPKKKNFGKLRDLLITCGKPVDNSRDSVDKPVDKIGDFCSEMRSYPQFGAGVDKTVDNSVLFHKLSTSYPQPEY